LTILERFEGDKAVIEQDGKLFTTDKKFVDKSVKVGDLLTKKGDFYYPDSEKTKARRQKIAELEDSLFE
jgi:hypothetical protein